ncbi:MAG: transglutaminase family protein [Sphingomonadaceae bacterium]
MLDPCRNPAAVETVRSVLAAPDGELDYLDAKLAFDRVIDPQSDEEWARNEIDVLEEGVRSLAGPDAAGDRLLGALRRHLYDPGEWNGQCPFSYDHSDPLGTSIPNSLLAIYLRRRRGNCVSMPILFLILAERLGLDVSLACAPLHLFVRYRADSGQMINLETTSGGHPARNGWYRKNMPMSDRALVNGLYLRSLNRRENIAAMAERIVEYLLKKQRAEEAIDISELLVETNPRDVHMICKQATAYAILIKTEFEDRYPQPHLIPHALRARYAAFCRRNAELFAHAEMLGWQPGG